MCVADSFKYQLKEKKTLCGKHIFKAVSCLIQRMGAGGGGGLMVFYDGVISKSDYIICRAYSREKGIGPSVK